jgi:gamma-glutamyltranspeptidase/glutathione hydrolase
MNVVDHGMNVAEATVAPRIHHQWLPEVLRVEEGISPDTVAALEAKGHVVEVMETMGSAQSILVDDEDGLLLGGADTRQTSSAARGY